MAAPPQTSSFSLDGFHPAVREWFRRRFPAGPTPPQELGWPMIAAGKDTLIAAPTGSGKTLSAFLVTIDRFYQAHERGKLEGAPTQVVYVSPLKALAVDIQQNLEAPLAEIAQVARELGFQPPALGVAVRSGDTPAGARSAMLKRPPHFLITTPESLYLMITAARSRELLCGVKTVIVDEIHALARDKRGSHLALTLERLEHVSAERPVRIGLSATQRPIETVARLLVGAGPDRSRADGSPRCMIVDTGHQRELDLAIELPDSELEAVAPMEQVGEVLDRIARHVASRRTTLVFVNTRRLAERLAHLLAERLGEDQVAAHHGSLSKDRRLRIEERLRAGELRALVATASLELGIDVGPVELVCQIGSPRSLATFLQRVGRSGHSRWAVPVGRLYPLTRDELVECTALLRGVRGGRLDALLPPILPLDVLAQQIVAEVAAEDWDETNLYELFRRAAPYAGLSRAEFDEVVELVSEGVLTGRGRRGAYLQRDRVQGRLHARRGARMAAITSGGAIPEAADYRVVADPDETFVGTINEDFAIESMAGDVFLLGSTSWRIRRVERGLVRVVDAHGATPTIPFWLGEAPARTAELSEEVSALRAGVDVRLAQGGSEALSFVQNEAGVSEVVARSVIDYLGAGRSALGILPTHRDILFERFFDETGGMQLVVHAPFGGRINRALGLLLRKRFCRSFDFELQAAASDDAIVLSLGPQHAFSLEDLRGFLRPDGVDEAMLQGVLPTPMFGVRWRWNLGRALLVLRFRSGRKTPPPIQRMDADDLMAAIFPALAACQDNAQGPRQIPDHPIVRQTLYDCMHEALDLDGLKQVLQAMRTGEIHVHLRETTEPSVLTHEILNSRPYTFLDDAPLEERRTRAVQLRRGLPLESKNLAELDAQAVERVRAEARPEPRDADELADLLGALIVLRPEPRLQPLFDALVAMERAFEVGSHAGTFWAAREKRCDVLSLLPDARFTPDLPLPPVLSSLPAPETEISAAQAVRGHLDISGPVTVSDLASATGLAPGLIRVALGRLEAEGFALRGRFDPARADREEEVCARRLLGRIHAYTHERLRREIEPVTAQDFMRFLLRWQKVAPKTKLAGRRGVVSVVEQLQGFEAAVAAWEPQLLAARIEDYRTDRLDAVCLSGEVVWGRLSLRAPGAEPLRGAALSRATPITLALRGDLPWLLQGARGATQPSEAERGDAARVAAALRDRGALFMSELVHETGLLPAQLEDALWDGVARGLVTADGFQPLRALLQPAASWKSRRPHPRQRRGLRRGASGGAPAEGRWAMLPRARDPEDPDALAEAVAEQLLARYGVLFRDLAARETLALPWRDVVWALRRLEARGVVRGGRFVSGFVGEQYALPTAVEALRAIRRVERTGEIVHVSGSDPLNLVGIVVPGERVPALRTQTVSYCDGAALGGEDARQAQLQSAQTS